MGKKEKAREGAWLTQMADAGNLVEFDGLRTCFFTEEGVLWAADGVSFSIPKGETVAVVGESGCGKSVTSLSLMGLIQRPQGAVCGGRIRFNLGDGRAWDIPRLGPEQLRELRGREIAMVFQEPMTSLNPVLSIGRQVDEAVSAHGGPRRAAARARSLALLARAGIGDGARVCGMYPHQLSGGMRQRVVIAMALAGGPRLLIADEPTTALDMTVQAQILALLRDLKAELGVGVLLITHDLGVVAEMADRVVVMYAGRVVEQGAAAEVLGAPAHPYTVGLLAARPVLGRPKRRLASIPGRVPDPMDLPPGCAFRPRCAKALPVCGTRRPEACALSPAHSVCCLRFRGAAE